MVDSTQVQNSKKQPIVKNDVIDEGGKLRILVFDVNSTTDIAANTEINLVNAPAGKIRLISCLLNYPNLGDDPAKMTLTLKRKSIQDTNLTADIALKKDLELIPKAAGELNLNLATVYSSTYGGNIVLQFSAIVPANNIINGYILYIVD